MKSVFSKTWQQLTSKIWALPEVLATAVARVNIKPTTPFCTISQEISQWISTATGNNGSQLQQPVVTLDIPVASGPVLSVEMRKSLTLCCTLCGGSGFQSHNLHWPLSPTASPPQPCPRLPLAGSLISSFYEKHTFAGMSPGRANEEPQGDWDLRGKGNWFVLHRVIVIYLERIWGYSFKTEKWEAKGVMWFKCGEMFFIPSPKPSNLSKPWCPSARRPSWEMPCSWHKTLNGRDDWWKMEPPPEKYDEPLWRAVLKQGSPRDWDALCTSSPIPILW